MSGDSRYDVMRRSRAQPGFAGNLAAASTTRVCQRANNRVALIIAATGTNVEGTAVARIVGDGNMFGFVLRKFDIDAVNVEHEETRPLMLNIWDHGDLVNSEWFISVTGFVARVDVIEVIDPEARNN